MPQCILSPRDAKVSLTSLVPTAALFLVLNGKQLSSRKSVCVTYVVTPCFCSGFMCPASCPVLRWAKGVCFALTHGSPTVVHFLSSISEKAVMTKRKMMGDRLSPCRTPTVWSMSVDDMSQSVMRRQVPAGSLALVHVIKRDSMRLL